MFKKVIAIGLILSGLLLPAGVRGEDSKASTVVKLSHFTDDLHAAVMALKIAKMLGDEGVATSLFLNLEAVRLADKRVNTDLAWGHTRSVGALLDEAIKAGVTVWMCPHCAKAAGLEEKNLKDKVKMASEKDVAMLFKHATKVIDY